MEKKAQPIEVEPVEVEVMPSMNLLQSFDYMLGILDNLEQDLEKSQEATKKLIEEVRKGRKNR